MLKENFQKKQSEEALLSTKNSFYHAGNSSPVQMHTFATTFNPQLLNEDQPNFIKVLQVFDQDKWVISANQYRNYNWENIFDALIFSGAISLQIIHTSQSKILKTIQHIEFPSLHKLILRNNCIQNIQSLVFLNSLQIQDIDLSYNQLSEVKTLAKLSSGSLQSLQLQHNPLKKVDLCRTNCKHTKQIYLQVDLLGESDTLNEDMSFIMKSQSKRLQQNIFNNGNRLKQPQICKMIQKRFQYNCPS